MANTRINGRTAWQTDGWTLERRKSNIQSTFWGQTNVELSGRFVGWIVGLPIGDLMLYCRESFASRVGSYRVLNAAYKHYSLKTNTTDCSYIHVICTYVRPPVCMSDCRYGVLFVMSKKTMHSQKSTMVWAQWENFQKNAKLFRITINQYLTNFTCDHHIQFGWKKY